jgi:glycosyltransferase involved in cell wall biosynthesis
MSIKFYIVIPTKNREKTLYYSIKTVLNQDYENFEIIISDNFSVTDISKMISEFNDKRLIYQRSSKPLCMMNSWEFAMSGVNGSGLVHFMGDDNGLVPGALKRINELYELTGANIYHSDMINYVWPDFTNGGGSIDVPLDRDFYKISSKKALRGAFNQHFGFSRLPTINVAFVHTSVIMKAKEYGGGKYFLASNPDVYSAFINSFIENSYIYSQYPFIVNGASRDSNGGSTQKNAGFSPFVEDNLKDNYAYHRLFLPSTSYYLNVYEALAVMCDATNYCDFIKLFNFDKLLRKIIIDEYVGMNRHWLKDDILNFAIINNLKCNLDLYNPKNNTEPIEKILTKITFNNKIHIDNFPELMPDIYAASIFSGRILSGDIKYDIIGRCKNFIKQKFLKLILKY